MSRYVTVKNLTIGNGVPKICVPLTDTDEDSLICSLSNLKNHPFDLVEWRADFYRDFQNDAVRSHALSILRETLGDVPLLFTIRTQSEGGMADLSADSYHHINNSVIRSGMADLVDVELSKGTSILKSLVDTAKTTGVKIIASCHDFEQTPDASYIVDTLCRMQTLGADIAKYAVMPQCECDVLTLLDATLTMKKHHPDTPIITMSMGHLGMMTRICGSFSGSAVTFGTVGQASAPGQIPAETLKSILDSLS